MRVCMRACARVCVRAMHTLYTWLWYGLAILQRNCLTTADSHSTWVNNDNYLDILCGVMPGYTQLSSRPPDYQGQNLAHGTRYQPITSIIIKCNINSQYMCNVFQYIVYISVQGISVYSVYQYIMQITVQVISVCNVLQYIVYYSVQCISSIGYISVQCIVYTSIYGISVNIAYQCIGYISVQCIPVYSV